MITKTPKQNTGNSKIMLAGRRNFWVINKFDNLTKLGDVFFQYSIPSGQLRH